MDSPLPEVLFIELLTLRLIRRTMFKDMIEHTGQLMRGGGDCLRRAFARPQPPIITAQGRLGASQRLRHQAQHLCRTTVAVEGFAAQPLPPEISLCGANPSQEAKCFSVGHLLRSVPISDTSTWETTRLQASCSRQIQAQNPIQAGAHVKCRGVRGLGVGLGIRSQRRRRGLRVRDRLDRRIVLFDVGVAVLHLRGVEVRQRAAPA